MEFLRALPGDKTNIPAPNVYETANSVAIPV